MASQTIDNDLIKRRKTWKTVSFRGLETYDAFSRSGRRLMGDRVRFEQHKRHLKPLDYDYLMEHIWDDVFVQPCSKDALEMDAWEGDRLLHCVVIPHLNVCGYIRPGISFIRSISEMLRNDSDFVPADEFLHSVRTLSMVSGGGDAIKKLTNDNTRDYFARLLKGKVEFVDGDFKTYEKDTGQDKPLTQTLFLPGWVRNRLSHPENRFAQSFPHVGEYATATYLISALILVLLYDDDTPMFG